MKTVEGFALCAIICFYASIDEAKEHYDVLKERLFCVKLHYAKKSYNTKGWPNSVIDLGDYYRNGFGLPY